MSWKLGVSKMIGKITFPQLLQLWMHAWTMPLSRISLLTGFSGGSFHCDDWPLQETLPMKQHRKLGGWDKKSAKMKPWRSARQRYRWSGGRTVELSCSDVSFGWKWNKFLLWGDWGKYMGSACGHFKPTWTFRCLLWVQILSNKIKRASAEYNISCFFLPAQSWQLKAFSVG